MPTLEDRVAHLEKSVATYRRLTAGLLLAFVVTVGVAAVQQGEAKQAPKPQEAKKVEGPVADVVRARKFEVVNDQRTVTAALESRAQGGSLVLCAQDGTPRVVAEVGGRQAGRIWVLSREGKRIVTISDSGHGDGEIRTWSKDTTTATALGSTAEGNGFVLVDTKNRGGVTLSVDSRGNGHLGLRADDGKRLVSAGAGDAGNGEIQVFNQEGRARSFASR